MSNKANVELLTERDLIRAVPERWKSVYSSTHAGRLIHPGKLDLLPALEALDLETCSAGDVAAIIGNDSWTELKCEECGRDVKSVVIVGGALGSTSIYLCAACAREAAAVFSMEASAP